MIYVRFVIDGGNKRAVEVMSAEEKKAYENDVLAAAPGAPVEFESRWDWYYDGDKKRPDGFAIVERIAAELNEAYKDKGRVFIATDSGPNVSPQWDIVEAPKVGDKISYRFNGDSYPDGEIVKVAKNFRYCESSSGKKYYRRKLSGAWVNGKTWSMVPGHVNERNPSF